MEKNIPIEYLPVVVVEAKVGMKAAAVVVAIASKLPIGQVSSLACRQPGILTSKSVPAPQLYKFCWGVAVFVPTHQ